MFSVIPLYGDTLADYILAGPSPNSMTLRRIFTLHVILPFLCIAVFFIHVLDLHQVSSAGDTTYRLDVPRDSEYDFHRIVLARDTTALLLYA